MAAVGVLFGAAHPPAAVAVPMTLLGTLLCYIYERTARLAVPIAIHFLFNLFGIALMLSVKYAS